MPVFFYSSSGCDLPAAPFTQRHLYRCGLCRAPSLPPLRATRATPHCLHFPRAPHPRAAPHTCHATPPHHTHHHPPHAPAAWCLCLPVYPIPTAITPRTLRYACTLRHAHAHRIAFVYGCTAPTELAGTLPLRSTLPRPPSLTTTLPTRVALRCVPLPPCIFFLHAHALYPTTYRTLYRQHELSNLPRYLPRFWWTHCTHLLFTCCGFGCCSLLRAAITHALPHLRACLVLPTPRTCLRCLFPPTITCGSRPIFSHHKRQQRCWTLWTAGPRAHHDYNAVAHTAAYTSATHTPLLSFPREHALPLPATA